MYSSCKAGIVQTMYYQNKMSRRLHCGPANAGPAARGARTNGSLHVLMQELQPICPAPTIGACGGDLSGCANHTKHGAMPITADGQRHLKCLFVQAWSVTDQWFRMDVCGCCCCAVLLVYVRKDCPSPCSTCRRTTSLCTCT